MSHHRGCFIQNTPIIVVFPPPAREPAHNNLYGLLPIKGWTVVG